MPDTKFQFTETYDLVLASDVHIREMTAAHALKFIALLDAAIATPPKAFVLNGDIFDFFFGWSDHFRTKYREIFSRLETLAGLGSIVWFIEGNHEFGLEKMPKTKVRYLDSFGGILEIGQDQKVLIAHGDLMKNDPWYRAFRFLVRSQLACWLAIIFPQKIFDRWTEWFAKTSRKKDKYRTLNHQSILANAGNFLAAANAKHLVFGHFHHPYDEHSANGGRIMSVESWLKPNILVLRDGRFQRIYL